MQSQSSETDELRVAKSVMNSIETFYDEQGTYPMSVKDISTTNNHIIFNEISTEPPDSNTIEYRRCSSGQKARIGYWSRKDSEPKYLYSHPGSPVVDCLLITE